MRWNPQLSASISFYCVLQVSVSEKQSYFRWGPHRHRIKRGYLIHLGQRFEVNLCACHTIHEIPQKKNKQTRQIKLLYHTNKQTNRRLFKTITAQILKWTVEKKFGMQKVFSLKHVHYFVQTLYSQTFSRIKREKEKEKEKLSLVSIGTAD